MRVLIVHEWLTNLAGSEKVVGSLRGLYPDSPVATAVWWRPSIDWAGVRPSPIQRFVRGPDAHIRLLPLLPAGWASFRLPPADVVITSFHTFALYARVPRDVPHVVYCHTPPRFLWLSSQLAGERLPLPAPLAAATAGVLRPLDARRARRPTAFVANSATTATRIRRAYGRDAAVVHPPVDVARFRAALGSSVGDYHLLVSRLVPYKQVDVAVRAFTELGLPLVVAGTGRDEARLKALAGPTIRFAGHVDDGDLVALMAGARALVFPGEEDFGIVPVEAMAAGTPVVAFAAGGATETVVDGESGVFFTEPTPDALASAVRRANGVAWDRPAISEATTRFDEARFHAEIAGVVARVVDGA